MRCIIGLGNPEPIYEKTRHNAGWMALDALAPEPWELKKKFNAALLKTIRHGQELLLVKPHTYMNRSGEAIAAIAAFYQLRPEECWLVHDDIDLSWGVIRISQNRSAGGHRGVESIFNALHSQACPRFRIGIRPEHPFDTEAYVLQKFSPDQAALLPDIMTKTVAAIDLALISSPAAAATRYN